MFKYSDYFKISRAESDDEVQKPFFNLFVEKLFGGKTFSTPTKTASAHQELRLSNSHQIKSVTVVDTLKSILEQRPKTSSAFNCLRKILEKRIE